MNCKKKYNSFNFFLIKTKTISILLILLFFGQIIVLSSCSGNKKKGKRTATTINKSVILDVKNILGKSMKAVNQILGEPESMEKFVSPLGKKIVESEAIYNGNKFEIRFKDDKANIIFIHDTPDLTNDDKALEKLGLKNRKPTSITPNNYTSWENVEGIALINCFEDYIFIKLYNRVKSE